jgi:DNA-binding transcriptional LysR family regulator
MFADLLMQGGLSLDRLQSFCLVAEAGGVTKAAKGDPTRQSLYSRQIKELEEFFGIELVRRKGRGIVLTAAGQRLHLLAREQLLALSDFKRSSAGRPVELTVAAGESLIQWLLLPRLPAIQKKLPNVAFRLLNLPTAEIVTRLREGTVDLGLIRAGSTAPPLQSRPLGTMKFSLFVPARILPPAMRNKMTPAGFARLPLATLEGGGQFRQELERLSVRHQTALNIQLEVSSFPLMAKAVRTGGFAAVLPSVAAGEFAGSDVIELQPEFLKSLNRKTVLAWNPRMARIRAVVEKAIPAFRQACEFQ